MAKVKTKNNESTSLALMIPLMAVLGILPLIVFLYTYDCGLEYVDFYLRPEDYMGTVDFFLYWKMITFTVISVLMAIVVVFKLLAEKKEIKFTRIFIPLAAYGVLAFLSSIFSKYKPYPFTGIYEQFEPLWALLGYCVVAYYAYLYVNTEKDVKRLLIALTFSTVIILLIGMTQAFFTDFFRTDIGSHMIVPAGFFSEAGGQLDFTFAPGRVYLTVYNPNYVGSYVALLMPLFLMLVFGAEKIWQKIACGVLAVCLVLALFGSQSRAGFVGVFASLVLVLVVFNKRLIKYWAPVAAIMILLVGLLVGYDIYSGGVISGRFKNAFNTTPKEFDLTNIETLDDKVVFSYKGNKLQIMFNYDNETGAFSLSCADGDSDEVMMAQDGYTFTVVDDRFDSITINPVSITEEEVGFEVCVQGKSWYFYQKDGTYYMYSTYGKPVKAVSSESVKWLEERTSFASGRGFIWAKTIPLLKKNFILGSGADTFVFEFPNYDFLAMYNGGFNGQIMTKPHNMYLQIGVQTGVLSLIAVIVYYAWFFFYGIITMFRVKKHNFISFLGAGILCGTFGYMVVQLINDSSISVAPLYWTLTGIGLAIFKMVRESDIYVTKIEK